MKRLIFFFVFATVINQGWGQNQNSDNGFRIKLNNLAFFEEFQLVNSWSEIGTASETYYDYSNICILNPTIAIQMATKRKNLHEIELIDFSIGKNEFKESYFNNIYEEVIPRRGYNRNSMNLSLKYEYIYTFNKQMESKFLPSIGLGVNPQYLNLTSKPVIQPDWQTDNKLFIFRVQITPRISYFLTSNIFFDLSIPFTVIDFKYNYYYIRNYTIMEELRTSRTDKFSLFPVYYSGRIGIGFLF
jgi:hypothetical protein